MKTSKYLEIFAREAEELLHALRHGILDLEKDGVQDAAVQGLLRSVHTLKGSARMLDLEVLGQVTHHLEDLLKEVEGGARACDAELIDLLLVAVDALEALIAQAHSGGEVGVSVATVLAGLRSGRLVERPAPPSPAAPERVELETVRTSVARLDHLVNLLGEVRQTGRMFEDQGRQLDRLLRRLEVFMRRLRKAENYRQLKQLRDDFMRLFFALQRDAAHLGTLAEELHGSALELRMLPLATITDEFEPMVRALAREQEKEVVLTVCGEEVELDRRMLEATRPMLLHMLRNAVDHGIEPPEERRRRGKPAGGRIELTARCEGGFALLSLRDDGRGIDPEQVRRTAVERRLMGEEEAHNLSDEAAQYLILRPGFSTRELITDLSGRGVGMDVVKTNIEQVKGNLAIRSTVGVGTEMLLQIPLSLAVMAGLIIDCEGETYAVPLHYVSEVLRLSEKEILSEGGREVVRVKGATLPLLSLAELLGLPKKPRIAAGDRISALVFSFRQERLVCVVSRSLGVQELVVKGLGPQLKSLALFSGATLLGDGSPALILSVPDLFGAAAASRGTRLRQELATARAQAKKGRVLVVDDSVTTRTIEKNILESHGYEVETAISGPDALARLAAAEFDLVVSDVQMPEMSGFELTRRLRQNERTREIPVVIVTSLASDADRRTGIEVGAQAYIVKGSFDQGTLLQTVETLIG